MAPDARNLRARNVVDERTSTADHRRESRLFRPSFAGVDIERSMSRFEVANWLVPCFYVDVVVKIW